MTTEAVLAVDIGGTNVRLALVDATGNLLADWRATLHLSHVQSETTMIDTIAELLRPTLRKHPVRAIGIGFPGFFDTSRGLLIASPNLPYIHNLPLAKLLTTALSVPVTLQNDALCAALGEFHFGEGRDASNLLHITLGTGVGGGLILNGQPWTGESGMAMEFGHTRVHPEPTARWCGCGNQGCLEAYASATAITRMYADITGERLDAKQVQQRAREGDSLAHALWTQAGSSLGAAIAQCVVLLDIHRITISGGLLGAWDLFYPALHNTLERVVISAQRERVSVRASRLNDRAGLLGAAILARLSL
ncbi:MAG: ROK family protein [Zetaproteobacteria bacterium]|nr:MAG: ROK family protein [Zetaproteobacteria bacterium]